MYIGCIFQGLLVFTWDMQNIIFQNTFVVPKFAYWGRVTHICASKLTTIGSDSGLSPGRRQVIIWTNAGILLIRNTFQWNLRQNSYIFSQGNAFENIAWKMSAILSLSQCVKLPCVTPPRRVSLDRQVCHHCLPRRLSLWQPPAGPVCRRTDASVWVLLIAMNVQIFFYRHAPVYMYCYRHFKSLIIIACQWRCILNEIFVWTHLVNKLLPLLSKYHNVGIRGVD